MKAVVLTEDGDQVTPRARYLGRLAAEGSIRVPTSRVLPLEKGPEVLVESTKGHLHGKTVLTIP